MVLKNKQFPFWVVNPKISISKKVYECYRIARKEGDKYHYDARIIVSRLTNIRGVRGSHYKSSGPYLQAYSESTLKKFKSLNILPPEAKQVFIVQLFELHN